MQFEWDAAKARDNEVKHGVSFAEAAEVFGDDHSSVVVILLMLLAKTVSLSSVFRELADIWWCPILNVANAFV
jgi:hypothetical protein